MFAENPRQFPNSTDRFDATDKSDLRLVFQGGGAKKIKFKIYKVYFNT